MSMSSRSLAAAMALCLTASPGGSAQACAQFGLPGAFDIHQSNGFVVKVTNVRGSVSRFTANAYSNGIGAGTVAGSVTTGGRTLQGAVGGLEFKIRWNGGTTGVYYASIFPGGRIAYAETYDARNWRLPHSSWTMQNLPCL